MKINTNIAQNLTQDEKEVFNIVKEIVLKNTPSTQVFAVGGWTRDKLLGIPSDDIDLMVTNLTGEEFAKLVTDHIGAKEAHTIRSNPEKSKHITTSKAYIPLSSGKVQEIDFAQARTEVYNEDSRIPELKVATPQEDAMRRDLTINSLFYNIVDNKLEDFTGLGIKDMLTDTIRTPTDPMKTFSDDPLRIFRVIRFAAKYNGKIDQATYQAMTDPKLKDQIKQKISKERIGVEFVKMLKNPNSEVALRLLKDTGLWQDIISEAVKGSKYEGKMAELDLEQKNAHHLLTVWEHTMQVVKNVLNLYPEAEPEKKITMVLTALMHDIGKLYQDIWGESKRIPGSRSYHGHEEASGEISQMILKYLKIEPYVQQVSGLAGAHMRPHRFTEDGDGSNARALRRFIREMGEQSLDWLDVFKLATADAYSKGLDIDPAIVERYKDLGVKLEEALASLKPVNPNDLIKPILDGNEVMQLLNIKPSAQIKEILNFVKELKDEFPDITKEQAIEKVKGKYGYLSSQPQNTTPSKVKPPKQKLTPEQQQLNMPNMNAKDFEDLSRQASSTKKEMEYLCPMTIVKSKIDEINQMLDEKKYYEVFTTLNELKEEYGNDESIVRLLASGVFKLLLKNEKYKYLDLIQHIMHKAEANFFDPTLCSYVVGILLLLETETKDQVIEDISDRMITMAPDLLRKIMNQLPNDVKRPELKQRIQRKLSPNC